MNDDWKGDAIIRRKPKRNPCAGNGHNFKKSGLSKRVRGESDKAKKPIFDENMKSETKP